MITLYIAGPMSNYPEFNYPAFNEAERQLRAAGYGVLNPTVNKADSWDGYMRASIRQVVAAEGMAVLPGWDLSAGAVLEVRIAHSLRMPVLYVGQWVAQA